MQDRDGDPVPGGREGRGAPGHARAEDEEALLDRGMNRVTDTCIPETVMRHFEGRLLKVWADAQRQGVRKFPVRIKCADLPWVTLADALAEI